MVVTVSPSSTPDSAAMKVPMQAAATRAPSLAQCFNRRAAAWVSGVASAAARGSGILSPIVTYWVSLGAGETQGAELGRVTAVASLGQALGSAAGGLLFDVSILPGAVFTATAGVVLAGLIASLGLPGLLLQSRTAEHVKLLSGSSVGSSADDARTKGR